MSKSCNASAYVLLPELQASAFSIHALDDSQRFDTVPLLSQHPAARLIALFNNNTYSKKSISNWWFRKLPTCKISPSLTCPSFRILSSIKFIPMLLCSYHAALLHLIIHLLPFTRVFLKSFGCEDTYPSWYADRRTEFPLSYARSFLCPVNARCTKRGIWRFLSLH